MHRFTDATGRSWEIMINVATIKRVRDVCGVDLLDLGDGGVMARLASDPVLLADVLFVVCDAERRGTPEDFASGLAGDAIEHATAALIDELLDFFPPKKRLLLRKAVDRMQEMEQKAIELASQRLDDPALMQEIESQFALSESGD